jgi:membrane protein DedA with SNARE-associated domain
MYAFLFFVLKTPGFTHFVSRLGYIGIIAWFITFDQLTPIPEEISLLMVGYLSAHHIFNPVAAGICCLAGFIGVDIVYFFLSKKGSSFISKKIKASSSIIDSYKNNLKHNTFRAVLVLCFIPRMRMFAPILAGSMKLSFRRFLLCDSIALAAFTTIYLLIGIIFNKSLGAVIAKTKWLQDIMFLAAVVLVAVLLVVWGKRRRVKKEYQSTHRE